MKLNKTLAAITTLIGTVIGAGILGIPYVVSKSGFPIGLAHLAIIGFIVCITSLYLGELGLRTKKNHQLPGYAELYLGKKGKVIMMFAFAFGIYASLLAYLIGESQSISAILFNSSSNTLYIGLAFWLLMSLFVYQGLKALAEGEKLGVSAIVTLILTITIILWNKISLENLSYINPSNIFTPFGVILFAFLGFAATPEIERILDKHKANTKKAIIISYTSIFLIYALFTLVIVGSQGLLTSEIATLNLGKIYIILGMITMLTSYMGLSIALMNTFKFDYNFSHLKSWLLTSLIPAIAFIILEYFSISSFSRVLGIGGALSGGITAILILLMAKQAKIHGLRKPEYTIKYHPILVFIFVLIFAAGAIFEIINLL